MLSATRTARWVAVIGALVVGSACTPSCALPAPVVTPAPAPGGLTVTSDLAGPGAPHIGLIGDSTLAAIRWTSAYAPLQRWNYVFDAESCRRTATRSCHGSDGHTPENVLEVMHRLNGRLGAVLVLMMGANDPVSGFAEAIDAVLAEASAQGIGTVVWLTVPGAGDKNAVLTQSAQQHRDLVVADWAGFCAPHPEWTNADGLHISVAGAPVLSQFIADHVAQVLAAAARPAPDPDRPPDRGGIRDRSTPRSATPGCPGARCQRGARGRRRRAARPAR